MNDIRKAALEMERIDTHGDWRTEPDDFRETAKSGLPPVTSLDVMRARMSAEAARFDSLADTAGLVRVREVGVDD